MAIEIELKLAINVKDLAVLSRNLPGPTAVKKLRNIYFDTPERSLEQGKRMLRLRIVDAAEGGILCYKGPTEHRDGVFRAEELEWDLEADEAAAFLADPSTQESRLTPLFPDLALTLLAAFGEIRVERAAYALGSGLQLEMDHVEYSDGSEDAELEVEAPEHRIGEARDLLGRILHKSGVSAIAQERTKYQRFLSRV